MEVTNFFQGNNDSSASRAGDGLCDNFQRNILNWIFLPLKCFLKNSNNVFIFLQVEISRMIIHWKGISWFSHLNYTLNGLKIGLNAKNTSKSFLPPFKHCYDTFEFRNQAKTNSSDIHTVFVLQVLSVLWAYISPVDSGRRRLFFFKANNESAGGSKFSTWICHSKHWYQIQWKVAPVLYWV